MGVAEHDAGIQRDIPKHQLKETEKEKHLDLKMKGIHFLVAAVRGVSLIGLMLLMTLYPGRNISLITTSVAVVLATVGFAFLQVEPRKVLLGTAAYATVLIVFVGASLAPTSPCTCSS